jgi:hypothetical protein
VEREDWREAAADALVAQGAVALSCAPSELHLLRRAVIDMQADPIDAGHLLLHPRAIAYERRDGSSTVTLELREAYQ